MSSTDLYSLFELSPVPMWVFDVQDLSFLDVNRVATEEYGYTREEFLSMDINAIRPVEDAIQVQEIVSANSRTGAFFRDVFRHLTKKGELIHVQVASNFIQYRGKKARLVTAINVTEKIKAERMLLENERRFKALVQDGSDMITIIDSQFRYSYVSPASKRVFGVSPDFFIGKKAFDFIHSEDLDRVNSEAAGIWEQRTIQLTPYRYRNADGCWIWVETRATNLLADPAVLGIVCTSKNVTERIRAEQLIAQNVERFRIVSKATSDVIWDCDLSKGEINWNMGLKGILRHDPGPTSLDWWRQHIHPQDRKRVNLKLNAHISKGVSRWTDEYRFLCGDGTYKNIFDRGFVMVDQAGQAYRMIGAMQDITKRKRGEEWSKLLESVVVNTSDGVLITDAGDVPSIIYVNQAMIEMSGFSKQELIGSFPDILHGSARSQAELQMLKAAVESKSSAKVELVNYTKQGKEYFVSVSLTPIFGDNGELVRWISIQRDVTERRSYVREIELKNSRLQDISWLQSHVVRTPLARMMSLMELLEQTEVDQQQLELLRYMRQSADELDGIIKRIANHG